ncbi:hypothetical protein NUU61_000275 [Penicillium alfredii]|uniref:DUF7707 domain-containing protein n=1 Tax=Penicillium alfredii TaxID=1506179 RepID=A0A9W9G9H2_9EURO|nr:uncharacterized protein NUU61_000275 [Penicillium alfredii]KAJ5114516.1 hypothetical protein NUU61_000275 [Penicillium alfredii]
MLSQLFLVIASGLTLVNSQSAISIDPSSVPLSTREAWCSSQTSSCPLLCLQVPGASGSPSSNKCTAETLVYSCICNNNVSPNASEYSQTIPYYVCTEKNNQCVKACQGNSGCQSDCRTDNPCGAQAPKRVNTTTSTTMAATSTATTEALNTMAGGATGAAPRLITVDMGQVYGLCVLVGGFIAGFAVLL